MPILTNSDAIKNLIQILINVVGRRTTKDFAVNKLESILNRLKQKYDFLYHINIENSAYSEKKDDVKINSEIDKVDTNKLEDAIDEIFNEMIKSMGKNVGYFYIKEIQEDLESEINNFFNKFDVNLNLKQQEHLLEIMESSVIKIQEIKNSEIFNIVISAFVKLLNRKISENFTKEVVMDCINNLQEKYDFLKYIHIDNVRDPRSPFQAKIDPGIDNIVIGERGDIIQKIIIEIGKTSDLEIRRFIGEKFEMLIDNRDIIKIKKIGVELDEIDKALRKQVHQQILEEIFNVILGIIENKMSVDFGVKYLDALIKKIKEKHEVLNYIYVDTSKANKGIDAIEFKAEINSVDSYDLGKAIKDILSRSQNDLKELTHSFFSDFEKNFNKKYLPELEKMGVNLHILELRSV